MSSDKSLSARESELAVLAWQALEDPKVDYQKLADVANFKNRNSASACFGPIRKKLLEGNYAASAASSSKTSATPKGKRTAAAAADDGEDGDDDPTPTKKPRGRPPKKAAAPAPAKDEKDNKKDGA